jgi:hypothetical protein
MALDAAYRALLTSLREITRAEPEKRTQLLALILAGKPFRPFLERRELLEQAVTLARAYATSPRAERTVVTRTGVGAEIEPKRRSS